MIDTPPKKRVNVKNALVETEARSDQKKKKLKHDTTKKFKKKIEARI